MQTQLFGVWKEAHLPPSSLDLSHVDGIELRVDALKEWDKEALGLWMKSIPLPVILTLRPKEQGGEFVGAEKRRRELLTELCSLKPTYLDLEYDLPESFCSSLLERFEGVKSICSYHCFEKTPEDLQALFEKIKRPHKAIYKIAAQARSTQDALRMLAFVKSNTSFFSLIGISMGACGQITRLLAPLVKSPFTYAALGKKELGQLSAQEMQEIYHFKQLNEKTHLFALIGNPIENSPGARVHNAFFRAASLNCLYVKIALDPLELPFFFDWCALFSLRGLSVTMPYKESVMPFLDQKSDEVEAIGACNTICFVQGKRWGFNTDAKGALDAIEEKGLVENQRIFLFGAGGTAKAIAFEALRRGAFVSLFNRNRERAQKVAEELGCEVLTEIDASSYAIVVNATPQTPDIPDALFSLKPLVMDCVHHPKMTPFLQAAEQSGCQLVFGEAMYHYQAMAQQQIWAELIPLK